uniref:Uncharacterized protein n=1 Tax=Arundo donax TaxID=35708 RepID=A0A0A8YYY9_ARUDO
MAASLWPFLRPAQRSVQQATAAAGVGPGKVARASTLTPPVHSPRAFHPCRAHLAQESSWFIAYAANCGCNFRP